LQAVPWELARVEAAWGEVQVSRSRIKK
jgi:hypothetical protein